MNEKENRPRQRAASNGAKRRLPEAVKLVKTPPTEIEAEQSVLGTLLAHPGEASKVATKLTPDDFTKQAHRTIFHTMMSVQDTLGLDPSTGQLVVQDRLRQDGELDRVGGLPFLAELVDVAASPVGLDYVVGKVKDASMRRRAIDDGLQTITDAINADHDTDARRRLEAKMLAAPIGGELAGIEFLPASALGSGDQVDWPWTGWVASGFVTLLVALWKAGKTTLLTHFLKATSKGGDLAGNVQACNVLVVTEEGQGLWARRRDDVGIEDNVQFLVRPFKGRPTYRQWEKLIAQIATKVEAENIDVVLFDTWQSVSPCPDENDAAKMMAALTPLHRITEAGAAVLLVHHTRKGDGTEGQASRGSGAFTGFVDIIAELRRYDPERHDDTQRVLRGLSRFDETPKELVIDLREDGYHVVGTKGDAKQCERMRVIGDVLQTCGGPLTAEEVRDAWPTGEIPKPGLRTLKNDLNSGCSKTSSKWLRTGDGKKGDPYRYTNAIPASSGSYMPESNLNINGIADGHSGGDPDGQIPAYEKVEDGDWGEL